MPLPYLLVVPGRLSPPEPVADLAAASRRYAELRDASLEGASTWPDGLINDYGCNIAHISYNARVWPMGEFKPGTEPLYDPAVAGD